MAMFLAGTWCLTIAGIAAMSVFPGRAASLPGTWIGGRRAARRALVLAGRSGLGRRYWREASGGGPG